MTDDVHGASICPSCGKVLDAAIALEDGGITPGDISIGASENHDGEINDRPYLSTKLPADPS